jgi:hypothetical protein
MTATGLLTNGKHETGRSGTAPTATETNGTVPRTSGRPETATNGIAPSMSAPTETGTNEIVP